MSTRARYLVMAMRAFVLAVGTAALWLTRDGMNPDGAAYLDASDVYLAGNWPASGSGYWSPAYPTLLALARLVAGTEPARELAITQAVNFLLFLVAFGALEFFVRSARDATAARQTREPPNDAVWLVLVYTLFAVASVGWIRVWLATPDMGVAAIAFAIGGVSVRIAAGRGGWPSFVLLGVTLGLGYLAKAALLPVGVAVLATLAVVLYRRPDRSRVAAQVTVAAMLFFGIAAPQIAYVSRLKGDLTFSDVGRLSHLWFIAGVPGPLQAAFALPAALPSPDRSGQTLAPLEPRDPEPVLYDIDAPIPGTLPIWYDAGHWYRGVVAPRHPLRIVRAIVRHARVYLEVLGLIIVGGLGAALATRPSRRDVMAMRPAWVVVVPALAACAMYALVLVQTRYIAPFVLLLFAGLVPPWAGDDLSRRLRTGFAVGAVALVPLMVHQVKVDATFWRGSAPVRANFVAALQVRGIGPGSRLGFIGDAYDAHWARQARVRFTVLLPRPEAPKFWRLDAAGRSRVLDRMVRSGTQAIVAETPPLGVDTAGWETLPSAGVPQPELLLYRSPSAVARR